MTNYTADRTKDPYELMTKRVNALGFNKDRPGIISANISLQINIVISGNGIIDTSKKVGFFGLSYSNLAANIQALPAYEGPKLPDGVVGIVQLSVDPALTKFRNTP